MNENLIKLKALVKETNQVVANLKDEYEYVTHNTELLEGGK